MDIFLCTGNVANDAIKRDVVEQALQPELSGAVLLKEIRDHPERHGTGWVKLNSSKSVSRDFWMVPYCNKVKQSCATLRVSINCLDKLLFL